MSASPLQRVLADVDDTHGVGVALGTALSGPFVLGLVGDLGAGKTHLARGIVEGVLPGWGVEVASPTYAICHTHGEHPFVHHLDLYRLEGDDDLESVGFWELVNDIVLVEWPSKARSVVNVLDAVVELRRGPGDERGLSIVARTERGHQWLAAANCALQ